MKRKEILVLVLISLMLTLIAGCAGPSFEFGVIDVNSSPDGAKVYINGEDTGMVTPVIFHRIVGDYTIKLDLFHYKIWEGTVTINADQTTYIYESLPYADEGNITLQPGAKGKDATVTSFNADTSLGGVPYLDSGKYITGGMIYYYRSYLQFDLSNVPGNLRVVGACLKLRQIDSSGTANSNTIGLYQVTSDWGEYDITWNNQPTSSTVAESSCTVYAGSTGWRTWYNIGDLVKGWFDGSIANQGMLLKATDETSIDLIAQYLSSDSTFEHGRECPKLRITCYNPIP